MPTTTITTTNINEQYFIFISFFSFYSFFKNKINCLMTFSHTNSSYHVVLIMCGIVYKIYLLYFHGDAIHLSWYTHLSQNGIISFFPPCALLLAALYTLLGLILIILRLNCCWHSRCDRICVSMCTRSRAMFCQRKYKVMLMSHNNYNGLLYCYNRTYGVSEARTKQE